MNFLLKKFPKFPYTALVAISPISWGILCTAFAYFLILGRADFEATGTGMIFILATPVYMLIAAILGVIKYGGSDLLKSEEVKRELNVLNNNIDIKGNISKSVSDETLKEIFYSISKLPISGSGTSIKLGSLVLTLAMITEWIVSGETTNVSAFLISAAIGILLLSLFIVFFAQRYVFPTLKQCRDLLMKRNLVVEEVNFKFNNLKIKLNFFLLIPILIVLVVLSIISSLDLEIIILSLIGLVMATMVSRELSISVYDAFEGIKEFANDLSTDQKSAFSSGSLDPEIITLSTSLNKAAEQVYTSRNKLEKSKEELEKRIKELEDWQRLTVGRGDKMKELKKELKDLKANS